MAWAAKHKKWENMLLAGGGGARKNEWEEFERCKGLNRKNEMILDKEKLPRQLFYNGI